MVVLYIGLLLNCIDIVFFDILVSYIVVFDFEIEMWSLNKDYYGEIVYDM